MAPCLFPASGANSPRRCAPPGSRGSNTRSAPARKPSQDVSMDHLSHFAPLAERYDGFVLDLWGVIHDGVKAFPHAIDCLAHLRDAGKRTLLLSNVPRPNEPVRAMMRGMGIEDASYTDILTSGEAVRQALLDPPD